MYNDPMQSTFVHGLSNLAYFLLKPYIRYRFGKLMPKMHYEVHPDIDLKRKIPFLLIGNHQFEVDWAAVGTIWKNKPSPVLARSLVISAFERFKLEFLASGLITSPGEKQMRIIRDIDQSIKLGRPVLVFPEGEITNFGESRPVDKSIGKLVKILNTDVIIAKCKNGFMSLPRWGTSYRKDRAVFVEIFPLFKREQLPELDPSTIHTSIEQAIYHNDFADQRTRMRSIGGDAMAEGLDDYVYVCSACHALHTLEARGNSIHCSACSKEFLINEYGFIENAPFDTLVDWNNFQKQYIPDLKAMEFSSPAVFYDVDYPNYCHTVLGEFTIRYASGHFHFEGTEKLLPSTLHNEPIPTVIPVNKLLYVTLSHRNALIFSYQNRNYFIKIAHRAHSFRLVCEPD